MENQNVKPEPVAPESEGAYSRSHLSLGSRVRSTNDGATGTLVTAKPNAMGWVRVQWDEGFESPEPISCLVSENNEE